MVGEREVGRRGWTAVVRKPMKRLREKAQAAAKYGFRPARSSSSSTDLSGEIDAREFADG